MSHPDATPAEPGPDASAEDLQADIDHTRAELGQTVGALTAKLDVKARARDAAADAKRQVADQSRMAKNAVIAKTTTPDGAVKPAVPVAAVAALVAVAVGVVIWRRRR